MSGSLTREQKLVNRKDEGYRSNPRLRKRGVDPATIPFDCHSCTHYRRLLGSGLFDCPSSLFSM